jgi:secreted trypsin-like serine protease
VKISDYLQGIALGKIMIMGKYILSLVLLCLITPAIAGIYRHDVPPEKYKQLAMQSPFDCVGAIITNGKTMGSCVLIGQRFVLSAAHCFIESSVKHDTIKMEGGGTMVAYNPVNERVADVTRYYIVFNGRRYNGKTIKVHPMYLNKMTKGTCDIALIELSEVVENINPIPLNTNFNELNSIVTGVGYGHSGPANQIEKLDTAGIKIAGQNTIDVFGGYKINGEFTLLICDFDHPSLSSCNKSGSSAPLALEYLCGAGDSGGGLLRETKDGWELVGICSGGGTDINVLLKTGYYGQSMEWTRVSVFSNWVKEAITELEKR